MKRLLSFLLALHLTIVSGIFAAQLTSPPEQHRFRSLTSHAEMMQYLKELARENEIVNLQIIGHSVQGREIPALFFTTDPHFASQRDRKPVILIYCQQHGNEPSGKEAALLLTKDLLTTEKSLLNALDVILVPQVNPDGAEAGKRRNAHNMDLNRNHVILSEPEAQALHQLFLDWMPEVTLDVHEYNAIKKNWVEHGYVKDAEEMMGTVTNLNIDSTLIRLGRELIPETGKRIQQSGFTFHRYVVGSPFEGQRLRFSTTNINDGRQSMGIYNTLSFIIEGKRYGDLTTRLERRTLGQHAALLAFLHTMSDHTGQILTTVTRAREKLLTFATQSDYVHIQMDYFPDPAHPTLPFPVFNLYTWHHEIRELDNFYPLVQIKKSVKRPRAYLIPGTRKRLIQLLNRHRIRMYRVETPILATVEQFFIRHITPRQEEDKPALMVDGEFISGQVTISKEDILIPLNQPAANLLPLILEPQSTYSIAQQRNGRKYRFAEFLQESNFYPVRRLPQPLSVKLIPILSQSLQEK